MKELRHRVCLLEFGLGSVAKVIQDLGAAEEVEPSNPSEDGGTSNTIPTQFDPQEKNRKAIEQIVELLQDVENCVKYSAVQTKSRLSHDPIKK